MHRTDSSAVDDDATLTPATPEPTSSGRSPALTIVLLLLLLIVMGVVGFLVLRQNKSASVTHA